MDCKRSISIIIIVGLSCTCLVRISAVGQTKEPKGGRSLLIEEMVALDAAFETIIDAVIFSNMELIKPAVAELRKTRGKVEDAISAGQRIKLPKNQDKFKEFVELDDKFHEDLGALEKAAETGQKKVAKNQTHKLLDACVACHEKFRK
jgi:cytochrome c556